MKSGCDGIQSALGGRYQIRLYSGEDRFFFICSLIDIYDRSIMAYHVGLECTAENIVHILNRALLKRQQFETRKSL